MSLRQVRAEAGGRTTFELTFVPGDVSCSVPEDVTASVTIRQHTSAYVRIRQDTLAYVSGSVPEDTTDEKTRVFARGNTIRQHTQHTSAYVSISTREWLSTRRRDKRENTRVRRRNTRVGIRIRDRIHGIRGRARTRDSLTAPCLSAASGGESGGGADISEERVVVNLRSERVVANSKLRREHLHTSNVAHARAGHRDAQNSRDISNIAQVLRALVRCAHMSDPTSALCVSSCTFALVKQVNCEQTIPLGAAGDRFASALVLLCQ